MIRRQLLFIYRFLINSYRVRHIKRGQLTFSLVTSERIYKIK